MEMDHSLPHPLPRLMVNLYIKKKPLIIIIISIIMNHTAKTQKKW